MLKTCHYCGEQIKKEAIKCRFCGEFLTQDTIKHETSKVEPPVKTKTSTLVSTLNGLLILITIGLGTQFGLIGGLIGGAVSAGLSYLIVKFGDSNTTRGVALGLLLILLVICGSTMKLYQSQDTSSRLIINNSGMLDTCLANVETAYTQNWASSCKVNAQRIEDGYINCIGPHTDSQFCRSLWGNSDPSANCLLPENMAEQVEDWRKEGKSECFYRYPVN